MSKVLFANGCSFTQGAELCPFKADFNGGVNDILYEEYKRSYPMKITKKIPFDKLFNYGTGGGSNARIIRTTVEWVEKYQRKYPDDKIFALISFTELARHEYAIEFDDKKYRTNFIPHSPEKKILLRSYHEMEDIDALFPNTVECGTDAETCKRILDKKLDSFYKAYIALSNDKMVKDLFITQLIMLVNYLEAKGINYFFTFNIYSFINIYDLEDHNFNPARFYITETFDEFCKRKKVKYHPSNHPFEYGHDMWAANLVRMIKQRNLL